MRILVIGGTMFLGRHLVEAALAAGHDVTLFNRGRTNPELFPGVERLTGDRTADLTALDGRRWDAVVDTCGYVPRVVRASAEALRDATPRYLFVSTISVYAETHDERITEASPLEVLPDPTVEQVTGETYGGLKVLCEETVRDVFGDGAVVVRPGLIVGPQDPTDRFTYWPRRVARGGEVLAPPLDGRVQVIDARDLGAWIVRALEAEATGTFNATGPAGGLAFGEMLEACRAATGADARFVAVSDEFLLEHDVQPWMGLPLWLPAGEAPAMSNVDASRAIAAGLTFRPIEETARDTYAWDAARPPGPRPSVGLTAEREEELLAAWRAL